MKDLIKRTKIFALLILSISFIGCEEDDTILPVVTAGFTHTISQASTVTFINTSTNADSYSWDLGDESTSTEINPIKTYSPGTYNIVLTASNVAGASDTFEDTIIILDSEIPLITLIGDATISLTLGDTFLDDGATALDEVDGDLTANIIVGGDTVDTAVEDIYVITYDVTDNQGNEAIQVTRTVNVSAIVCTPETSESIAATDLNISFQTNTPAVVEDNTTFTWIDNPDAAGPLNTSCKVGQATRANNSPFDNIQIDLADKLNFNTSEGIKMKVWSPVANTPVLLKLEEIGNAGNFVELLATTSVVSGWEELTFDFAATATPQFNKMVIFFNFNVADGSTYYFDDLMVYGAGTGGGCVPETSESIAAANLNITFQTNTPAVIDDNTTFTWIDNPDAGGPLNTSCKVGQATRANNSPFDNIQIDLADKLDFNISEGLKMKVWSPVPNTPVLLKLEEIGNAGNFVELLATTSVVNGWEELTFDFAATATPQFNKLVIFFNFNVADGSTYYFDDLMVYGSGGGGGGTYDLAQAIDFESSGFGASWVWNVFENDSNLPLEFVANPVSGGINTSATVAKITALQTGQPFVGTETAHGEMGITWDISASNAIVKIMVYKTKISDVGIKFATPSGGAQPELKVANTLINQWEELTFDFTSYIGAGDTNGVDQIIVFPDFIARTADDIIYFDNITFSSN